MAEFVFAGPDMYECSDDEIFDACGRVRNRYSILHNLIFEAFKSGVPTKEIHVRVSEPSTWKRKDTLHIDRLLNMEMLRHFRNPEELFEEVFKDMVDKIYEERKKRDMDVNIQRIKEDEVDKVFIKAKKADDLYINYDELRKQLSWSVSLDSRAAVFMKMVEDNRNTREVRNLEDKIKEVIFNDPATIVLWKDGTKTVVKCGPGDTYDPEKGLALCMLKKQCGNKGNFNNLFRKYLPKPKTIVFVPTPFDDDEAVDVDNDAFIALMDARQKEIEKEATDEQRTTQES